MKAFFMVKRKSALFTNYLPWLWIMESCWATFSAIVKNDFVTGSSLSMATGKPLSPASEMPFHKGISPRKGTLYSSARRFPPSLPKI